MTNNFKEDYYIEKFQKNLKCEKPQDTKCSIVISEEGAFIDFVATFCFCKNYYLNMYIRTALDDPDANCPISLKITMLDNYFFQREIKPCINYLQRSRSPELTYFVLENAFILYNDRNSIICNVFHKFLNVVTLTVNQTGVNITVKYMNKFYFKTSWKIEFDIYSGCFKDKIEFILNKMDKSFRKSVLTYMILLTKVTLISERKHLIWEKIFKEVSSSIAIKTEVQEVNDLTETETLTPPQRSNNHCTHCSSDILVIDDESEDDIVLVTDDTHT